MIDTIPDPIRLFGYADSPEIRFKLINGCLYAIFHGDMNDVAMSQKGCHALILALGLAASVIQSYDVEATEAEEGDADA